jgi:hypothetical protein
MTDGLAISTVGSFSSNSGTKLLTMSASAANVGDLWMLFVSISLASGSATTAAASMSGGGVASGGWLNCGAVNASTKTRIEMWVGRISTSGSSTITMTLSGTAQASNAINGFGLQEIGIGDPDAIWTVDVTGSKNNTSSSTTATFPTLTPTGTNRAYLGYGYVSTTGSTSGGTSGYTVKLDPANNLIIYDPSTSGAQSPTGKLSSSGTSNCLGAMVYATVPVDDTVWSFMPFFGL